MSMTDPAVAQPWPLAAGNPGLRVRRQVGGWVLPAVDFVVLLLLIPVAGANWLLDAGYALVAFAVLAAQGQHRLRICLRVSDQLPQLAVAAGAPLVMLLPWLSGGAVLLTGASAFAGLAVVRGGLYAVLRGGYRRGVLGEPTLIVGSDPLAGEIAEMAAEHPEFGLRPRLLERPGELAEVVAAQRITRVLVCGDDPDLVTAIRAARPLPADVCVVPRLHELGMALPRAGLDEIWGVPLIPLRRFGHGRAGELVKRGTDVVLSGLMLLVFGPLLLVLTAVVALGGRDRAFFRQVRVTRADRISEVIKLRTVDGDLGQTWAVTADQCTALGRWLRGTHLDELPQLINVLRGDMSLVGPRPERPCYAVRFGREIPRYEDRHRVRGGMTGWAQVQGLHGDTSIPDRVRFDNQYVEYWSPWWDAVIVARTAGIVLRAGLRRAHRCGK
ncbi:Sugar transferase involved in LPS biosynthesis (colanic, teichoic acid) [Saccharopolyspora shandongensis]|uniref:Sugar transferase involved in LPS biosynthesis (Colanic, teichoic acid) n=1 Tax=Saccharopolyspora shandongensis TaxID=418495 RepID=A0A1H3NV97_9PSEU|nr:sugar transferase [Saccharopolyspora shandongensis]SDY92738.1 Sugar transferase involved in LPS biosynthesis (colanic, teichoic acid) [Saccharopolyspora shandongensis]